MGRRRLSRYDMPAPPRLACAWSAASAIFDKKRTYEALYAPAGQFIAFDSPVACARLASRAGVSAA